MIEFLKHLFGFCGEGHPNILTILIGTPVLGYILYQIKNYLNY